MREHGLPTVDPIHVATAVEHRGDTLVTNDKRLKPATEVPVVLLSEVTTP